MFWTFGGEMKRITIILAALLALTMGGETGLALAAPAQIITWDNGGRLDEFVAKFSAMRLSGQKQIIDGICFSACTLALGLLPPEQVCATPYAVFGFHSAAALAEDGTQTFSSFGTQLLWAMYPEPVRAFLRAHGWDGPTEHPILLLASGEEIFSMVRRCDKSDMDAP
jgi:hypothetical protein